MKAIVRRFDGVDLVISAAELSRMGVREGQYVSVRGTEPLPLILPLPAGETAASRERVAALAATWAGIELAAEVDAECEQESLWERWSEGNWR